MNLQALILRIVFVSGWVLFNTGDSAFAQLGEVVSSVPCLEHKTQTYSLFRPSDYSRKSRWPAIVLVDPQGQSQQAVAAFAEAGEEFGFIIASPQGVVQPLQANLNQNPIVQVYEDLIRRFSVDIDGIYMLGSGAASELVTDLSIRLQTNAGLLLLNPHKEALTHAKNFPAPIIIFSSALSPRRLTAYQWSQSQKSTSTGLFMPFQGETQWPDELDTKFGLAWLSQNRYQNQPEFKSSMSLEKIFSHQLAAVDQLEKKGDHLKAMNLLTTLKSDIFSKTQQATVSQKEEQLRQQPNLQTQRKAETKTYQAESLIQQQFESAFQPQALHNAKDLEKNLKWWSDQHKTLTYMLQNSKDAYQKASAARLIEHIWQVTYVNGLSHLEKQRFDNAAYQFRIASHLFPNQAYAHYGLACAFAGKQQPEQSLEALENSVAAGLRNTQLITQQPLFDIFRSSEGYQKILGQIEKK